ncbi:MAG: ribonuclease III [bacterium]
MRELEKQIGYRFKDRSLLQAALTHPSYCFEHAGDQQNNQRLEYLGDAVLGLLAAQYAFDRHATADEGKLTVLRSQVASGKSLAETARSIGLGPYLRMGKGEERGGGRDRVNMLADSLEAIFGAAWVDGDLRACNKLFVKLIAPRLNALSLGGVQDNPKGALQELAQGTFQCAPVYERLAVEGPAHAPVYRTKVRVQAHTALGEGPTRRAAEAAAATQLLEQLNGLPSSSESRRQD